MTLKKYLNNRIRDITELLLNANCRILYEEISNEEYKSLSNKIDIYNSLKNELESVIKLCEKRGRF